MREKDPDIIDAEFTVVKEGYRPAQQVPSRHWWNYDVPHEARERETIFNRPSRWRWGVIVVVLGWAILHALSQLNH